MEINFSNISFQKKLVAKCNVVEDFKLLPCKIYEIDPADNADKDYFALLINDKDWEYSWYLKLINRDFRNYPDEKFYAMEDNKDKCIAACVLDPVPYETNELIFLEAAPKYASDNWDRTRKYIGETMLTFLAGITKHGGKKRLDVPEPIKNAVPFYQSCGFRMDYTDDSMNLSGGAFNRLERQNERHVGKMEYLV